MKVRVLAFSILFVFISIGSLKAQPSNNPCSNATQITDLGGTCIKYDFSGATFDLANGSCATNLIDPNIWFSFVAQNPNAVINFLGGGFSVAVMTLVDCNTPPNQVACSTTSPMNISNLVVGTTYYIVVSNPNPSAPNIELCISNLPPPPNDDPCTAEMLNSGDCVDGTTVGSGNDGFVYNQNGCTNTMFESTVFYTITLGPNESGLEIDPGTWGFSGNMALLVLDFQGSCTNLPLVYYSSCGPPPTATITVDNLTPGTTYYILVSTTTANQGAFTNLCVTAIEADPPCDTNVDCASAEEIPTPATGEQVCITGCNNNMPDGPIVNGGGACADMTTPTSWFMFNSGPNNTVVFNITSSEITPLYALLSSCNTMLECNPVNVTIAPNTDYYIIVTDADGQEGQFDICLTFLNVNSPCVTNQQFDIVATSMGSPVTGPFLPGECITFSYSTQFIATGPCQWLHSVVPYFSPCFNNYQNGQAPSPWTYMTGAAAGNWNWYPAQGTTTWKPDDNSGSVIGINTVTNKICLVGTTNCVPFTGGGNSCSSSGTPMPPGWVSTNQSGTCSSSDPNLSWGIQQGCGSTSFKQMTFTVCIPAGACSCEDPEGFRIGITSFADGQTGGYVGPLCNGHDIKFKQLPILCCEKPTMVIKNDTTCSGVNFIADIDLQPVGSYLKWTVINANGVTGTSNGQGQQLSQSNLVNPFTTPRIVTYRVTPYSPTDCEGDPQILSLTVLPAIMLDLGPNINACPGSNLTINATISGGAGAPYQSVWSTGDMNVNSINISPSTNTTISITVTDANGCTATDQVQINMSGALTVDIQPIDADICQKELLGSTLEAFPNGTNPPFDYLWNTPWGTFTSKIIPIGNLDPGEYDIAVQVEDNIGCIGIGLYKLNVLQDPEIVFVTKPNEPLCPYEVYTDLDWFDVWSSGDGITEYTSEPPGVIDGAGNILTQFMIPGQVYTFTIKYTDITGCWDTAQFTATVANVQQPNIEPMGPYCISNSNPQSVVVDPVGGTLSGPGVDPVNLTFTPSVAGVGTHTINYIVGSGTCTKDTFINIIVFALPNPVISNTGPFCNAMTPAPFLSGNPSGGSWSGTGVNPTTGEIDLTTPPGTYNVTYTVSIDGCSNAVSSSYSIVNQNTFNLVKRDTTVCNDDPGNEGISLINLDNFLPSGLTGGAWSIIPPANGAVQVVGNTWNFFGVLKGSVIKFVYTLPSTAPCSTVTDTLTITVNDDCSCPELSFNSISALCNDGASIDLENYNNLSDPGTYSISSSPAGSNPATLNGSIFDPNGADPGTYTIRYTLITPPIVSVCPRFIEFTITVNPEVVFTMKQAINVCNDDPNTPPTTVFANLINFFTSAPVAGTWVNVSGVGVETPPGSGIWDFTGVALGSYNFTFTSTGAIAPCTNPSTTVQINVTDDCACPELYVITASKTFCNDAGTQDLNNMIFSEDPGTWSILSKPAGSTLTLNGSIFNAVGATPGTYKLVFRLNTAPFAGCLDSVVVEIIVNPAVVYTLQNARVCTFDPDNINEDILDLNSNLVWVSSVIPGNWSLVSGVGATLVSPGVYNFNGAANQNFVFRFTPSTAIPPCVNTPTDITVQAGDYCNCPDLPILGTLPNYCNNDNPIDLTSIQNGATGTWSIKSKPAGSNPVTFAGSTANITGKDAGTYQLRFKYNGVQAGCPDSAFVNLTLVDFKYAGMVDTSFEYCEGNIQILDLDDYIIGADNGGLWTETGINSANTAFDKNTGILTVKNLTVGSYSFRYSFAANNPCPGSNVEIDVTIKPIPQADAGPDQTLTCLIPQVTIGAASTDAGVYQWREISKNQPIANPNDKQITVTLPGVYVLRVSDADGMCFSTDTVVVLADGIAEIQFQKIDPLCFGDKNGLIEVLNITGGAPPYLYSYNGGPYSSNNSWPNLGAGIHTIMFKDANDCAITFTFNLVQNDLVEVEIGPDTIINLGDTILIDPIYSIPLDSISYIAFSSNFDFITCTDCFKITVFPSQTTDYTVEIKDKNGCGDKDTRRIIVRRDVNIYIPNVFSPNGDGSNDRVMISTNTREIKQINSFQIYDRWGEKVFEALNFQPNDPTNGWDGNLKGTPMFPAVFVYWAEIELFDGSRHILKGDITLVR